MKATDTYVQKLKRHSNRQFSSFQEKMNGEKARELLEDVLVQFEGLKDVEDWLRLLELWNETRAHIQTHFELIELAFQCNTKDESVEKEERRLKEEVEPVFDEWNAKIREKVLNSPYLNELKEKLGEQYFLMLKIQQDAFDPKNIELDTRLNRVLSNYTKLTGGASFEVDGKIYPLAHYKKFSNSPDPRLRKESFFSYSGWFLKNRNSLEDIFDQLVGLRNEMGQVLGHPNFIPLGYQKMRRVDYGPEEVAQIRRQIHEVLVPLAQQIHEVQARLQKQEKVKIWDMDYYPQWQLGGLKVPIEGQTQAALRVYRQLSPQLAEHFKKTLDWNLIDVEAREGKAPGAFCTDFSDYRVPFIFLNSVNEATDVTTLLHESGHSFQAWESQNIDELELRWPTLEACEVHSMAMEFLAYPYYEEFLSSEDAEKFKQRHLVDSILLLPYIAMVDEFQHQVYSGQAPGPEGRAKAWEALEEKYLPGLDFNGAEDWKRHRWIRQLHIFRAPFYYIDYAIAQIGAWQLWMQSLKDKEAAMQNYLNLCRLGGRLPLKEFFSAGRLKLPFEKGMLKSLVADIQKAQPLF